MHSQVSYIDKDNDAMEKYVVMGNPIEHSQSPFIHQLFSKQSGIDYDYGRLLVPLGEFDKVELMLPFLLRKMLFALWIN